MFISEVMTTAPQDERGALETKTYQELERLSIKYERVDNDSVESMDECVEISNKLGAEIKETDAEGQEIGTGERVDITTVNDGLNYIYDADAVEEIGWVWASENSIFFSILRWRIRPRLKPLSPMDSSSPI